MNDSQVIHPGSSLDAMKSDEHLGDLIHPQKQEELVDFQLEHQSPKERQRDTDSPDTEHLGKHGVARVTTATQDADNDHNVDALERHGQGMDIEAEDCQSPHFIADIEELCKNRGNEDFERPMAIPTSKAVMMNRFA